VIEAERKPPRLKVALVGSPNSGKTSLFNWITGSRYKTVNYPGSTVESHKGLSLPFYGETFEVIDTPGIYSLNPSSQDEKVTLDLLLSGQLHRVILVIDASQIQRQLLIALQLKEMGVLFSVALTMSDLDPEANSAVDPKILSEELGVHVSVVDGRLGGGVKELVDSSIDRGPVFKKPFRSLSNDEDFLKKLTSQGRVIANKVVPSRTRVEKFELDRWLVHSRLSLPLFLIVMTLLFSSVYYFAAPFMDMVDWFFATSSVFVSEQLGEGMISDFLSSGMIEGMGAVLVFVPQIFVLFFGLGLLEESGYLARASTLIDRPLHFVGLSGRSFVPLLSGFACAVPAVMATRNLKSARERWIAVFVLPFMTCSARLPVYALLLGFLFFGEASWKPGLILAAIYFSSALIGGVAAWILHKILKTKERSYFLMEFPPYRRPRVAKVFKDSLYRTKSYVVKAGPTIFTFVLILWVASYFPHNTAWSESEQLANSFLGQVGSALDFLFRPMGLDWRAGVALLSAFVAREVFVSSMAVIFNLGGVAESSVQASLIEQMKNATFPDGGLIFTTPTIVAMILFFMFALQCISTTGVTIKEMGSWKYGVAQLVTLNVVAYAVAVLAYQVLS